MNFPTTVAYAPEGPQPLLRETPPSELFPVHALGPLRSVVEAVHGAVQAPVAIPAASALGAAAMAVQGFANVETLGGDRPLSLYILTIAQSGERKSSCDGLLMSAIREYEREQTGAQREDLAKFQNDYDIWKGARERLLAEAKKGNDDARITAEADLDALGPEPAPPPIADRCVTEPTFEGLTRLFATGQPSLAIFSDEGGQFLGGHAMNSENRQKSLSAFNDLWQGNPIRRTRAGEGHSTLYGRRLTTHLMVQPIIARAFMSDRMAAESGFLPRFLICEPPSAIGSRLHANKREDLRSLQAFERRLRAILEVPMPMDPDTRELKPRRLPLSPEARQLLIQFSDAIEKAQAPGGDLAHVTAYASKAAEQAARISAVLTLWEDLNAPAVTGEIMANAITLAQHYLKEAVRLTDAAAISAETVRAEALRKWLLERCAYDEITVRDVVQLGPNALRESSKARAAIVMLEKYNWLVPLEPGLVIRGSARKESWRIVRR